MDLEPIYCAEQIVVPADLADILKVRRGRRREQRDGCASQQNIACTTRAIHMLHTPPSTAQPTGCHHVVCPNPRSDDALDSHHATIRAARAQAYTKEVVRRQPEDLLEFSAMFVPSARSPAPSRRRRRQRVSQRVSESASQRSASTIG